MQSYERAYRDPKSPLTPLTPLSCNTAFQFNFGGDNSLKDPIAKVILTPVPTRNHVYLKTTPRQNDEKTPEPTKNHVNLKTFPKQKSCSEKFVQIRSIFSPGSKVNVTPVKNNNNKEMKKSNKKTRDIEKLLWAPKMPKPLPRPVLRTSVSSDHNSQSKEFSEIRSVYSTSTKMNNSTLTDESNDLKKSSPESQYCDIIKSTSCQSENTEIVNLAAPFHQTVLPVDMPNSSKNIAKIVETDQMESGTKTPQSAQDQLLTCLQEQKRLLQTLKQIFRICVDTFEETPNNCNAPKSAVTSVTDTKIEKFDTSEERVTLEEKYRQTLKQIYRICFDCFKEKSKVPSCNNCQISPGTTVSGIKTANGLPLTFDTSEPTASHDINYTNNSQMSSIKTATDIKNTSELSSKFVLPKFTASDDKKSRETLKKIYRICFDSFEENSDAPNSNNFQTASVTTVSDMKIENVLPLIIVTSEPTESHDKKYCETLKQTHGTCNNSEISSDTTVSDTKVKKDIPSQFYLSKSTTSHETLKQMYTSQMSTVTLKQIYRICFDSFEEELNGLNRENSQISSNTIVSDIKITNDLPSTKSPLISEQIYHEGDLTPVTSRNIQKDKDCTIAVKSSVSSASVASLASIQAEEKDNEGETPQDQLSEDDFLTPLQETLVPKMIFSRPVKRILKKQGKVNASGDGSFQMSPFTKSVESKIISDLNISNKLLSTINSFTTENEFNQSSVALNPELHLTSKRQQNTTSSPYKWNWLENNTNNVNNSVRRKIGFKKCSPVPRKPLSPRVEAVLRQTGLCKWNKLFEKEEIDMEVLQVLTEMELEKLGILSSTERSQLLTECMKLKNSS